MFVQRLTFMKAYVVLLCTTERIRRLGMMGQPLSQPDQLYTGTAALSLHIVDRIFKVGSQESVVVPITQHLPFSREPGP